MVDGMTKLAQTEISMIIWIYGLTLKEG